MYCLRELEKKDLCIINKWHDNPEAIALLGASHCFVNLNIDEKWFDNYIINRGNVVCCTITDDTDECLGLVSLTGVDFWNRSAEFHIMIGDMENQNKGIGSFAINSMLHHAFYNMNLHRVTLSVLETSERARHVYEKIGFVYEGCKRKSYFKNGEYVNTLIYSILKDEYNKNFAVNFSGKQHYLTDNLLPSFCICPLENLYERQMVMEACDSAFLIPIMQRQDKEILVEKVTVCSEFFVAYQKIPIGYVAMYANNLNSREGYITLIGVIPQFQNLHVGKALLKTCLEVAKLRRMKTVKLEVKKNNENAIRFYYRNGFRMTGEETVRSYMMDITL